MLGSNSVIKEVHFSDEIDLEDITEEELNIISRALCDERTIDNTFSSNHYSLYMCSLLNKSWFDGNRGTVWDSIYYMMHVNSDENKVDFARIKILLCHFGGGITGVNSLASMHETVLPHAIEWMGRNEVGYNALFRFVQSFPTLFDISHVQRAGSKRRKL